MPTPHLRGGILGAFLGDSLALGAHWIYDQEEIAGKFGRIEALQEPATDYHPGKEAGDLTHLGDQTLLLLQTLELAGGQWELARFQTRWQEFWSEPAVLSYRDRATRETMEKLESGAPWESAASSSDELAGAARGIVLATTLAGQGMACDSVIKACREQTSMTHGGELALQASDWVAVAVHRVMNGSRMPEALEAALIYTSGDLRQSLEAGAGLAKEPLATAKRLGLSCALPGALSVVVMLLRSMETDTPREILIENVMAGGDSAARGLVLGGLLGAAHGAEIWPGEWIKHLERRNDIEVAISKLWPAPAGI